MPRKPILVAFLAVFVLVALSSSGSAAITNTRITSGPSGTIFTDSATFTFTSPEDGGFQCRLDSSDWLPCSSPKSYSSLADGLHIFEVRALNGPGHPDPTPTVAAFTVRTEAEPPQTTIVSGPSGTIEATSVSFDFTASEAGGFECRLDSDDPGAWSPCESPESYSSLTDGPHTFEVRAHDADGNIDPTPAVATFTIDTAPPVAAISSVPTGPPKPVAGQTFDLEPVEGNVELQCPGEDSYSQLVGFKQVPVGCLINTRNGVVDLTASKGSSGDLQGAHFWGGVFVATQEEGDNQVVGLKLAGRRMCERRGGNKKTLKKKKLATASGKHGHGRGLWGSGKGNYTTSGSYGSATVRGTTWFVVDRCDASTLFKVAEGIVWVRDFVKNKSLTLTAGQQYIAKAEIPRLDPDALP